jgi:aspartate aminotransferase
MFKDLCDYDNDPIEAMFQRLTADTDPGKIDLGIGVFRDDSGNVPVMQAVRKAEQQLFARNLPKSYMSPVGNADYCRDMERLAFGVDHPVLQAGRLISAGRGQCPSCGC